MNLVLGSKGQEREKRRALYQDLASQSPEFLFARFLTTSFPSFCFTSSFWSLILLAVVSVVLSCYKSCDVCFVYKKKGLWSSSLEPNTSLLNFKTAVTATTVLITFSPALFSLFFSSKGYHFCHHRNEK